MAYGIPCLHCGWLEGDHFNIPMIESYLLVEILSGFGCSLLACPYYRPLDPQVEEVCYEIECLSEEIQEVERAIDEESKSKKGRLKKE